MKSSAVLYPHLQAIGIALCLWGSVTLPAATYFVAPAGADTNNGSAGAPFREIRKALTVVAPGDTVTVADGSYKGFDAVGLGSASTVTTIIAPGRNAVITKTTDRGINNPNNIVVWQCTHLVLDGLRSFQAANAAVRIIECSHVTVRNGVFGNNVRWGIVTSHSDDLVLEHNECYGSTEQHGIYVANSGDRPIVRGNKLHDNVGSGLRSNGDVAQGGDGIITGALFENNLIYNNGSLGGAAMNLDGLQDGLIRNNVLYNNHATGIALFKGGGAAGPKGMRVLNNTIVMPADGRYAMRITDVTGTLTLRNNLLYNANTSKGPFSWNTPGDAALTDSDFNAFGGGRIVTTDGESTGIALDTWIAAGHEPHSLPSVTLPGLVADASAHDYRLKAGSALIDHGTTLEDVPTDIAGTARPLGPAHDIGAYEYGLYASWKSSLGIPLDAPAHLDTDADGVPLLLEYALNMDPAVRSTLGLPIFSHTVNQLYFAYTRFRADIQYAVETSADLRTWSSNGIDQDAPGPAVEASLPLSGRPSRQFMRLKVIHP